MTSKIADQLFNLPPDEFHTVVSWVVFANARGAVLGRLAIQDNEALEFAQHLFVLRDHHAKPVGSGEKSLLFMLFQASADVLRLTNVDVLSAAYETIDGRQSREVF